MLPEGFLSHLKYVRKYRKWRDTDFLYKMLQNVQFLKYKEKKKEKKEEKCLMKNYNHIINNKVTLIYMGNAFYR